MIPEQYEAVVFFTMLGLMSIGVGLLLIVQWWHLLHHDELQRDLDELAVDLGGRDPPAWPERPRRVT